MHQSLLFSVAIATTAAPSTSLSVNHAVHPNLFRHRSNRITSIPTFSIHSTKNSRIRKNIRCTNRQTSTVIYSSEKELDELISNLLSEKPASSTGNNSVDPYSQYTHQIAIPLSTSPELTSALRGIQTSLVRDCPRLIRACVMPATLRLPLLYVNVGRADSVGGNPGGLFGAGEADGIIENIVQDAIRTAIYGETKGAKNEDGIGASLDLPEPIMLPFRGLELQGEDNSVLYAVGYNSNDPPEKKLDEEDDDGVYVVDDWSVKGPSGYERLELLVKTIKTELEAKGYKVAYPSDEPQGNDIFEDATLAMLRAKQAKQKKWRPRVPFVRLPDDFYDGIENDKDHDNLQAINKHGEDEQEMDEIDAFFAKGFDGISPTFWYEAWAEEDILPSPGVRMRSVQVYRRMMSGGGESEASFYAAPSSASAGSGGSGSGEKSLMDLPVGDGKQMERERRETAKEMERMGEVESKAEREWEEGKARWLHNEDSKQMDDVGDYLEEKDYSEMDISIETGDVVVDGDAAYSSPWSERGVDAKVPQASSGAFTDSEISVTESNVSTEEAAVQSQSSSPAPSQQADPSSKKKLPSIEDNPVFQRLWKGEAQLNSQGESTAQSLDGSPSSERETLPPYPSDEYFVGIWKIVQSPLGIESLPEDSSSKSSDNLVLRVDGQVMGGPILDVQYQQKAAGGSWKMFQAVLKSRDDEVVESPVQTRLRIKLLVPPEKEKMLVLEGEVTRLGFGRKGAPSSSAFVGPGGLLDGMSTDKLLKDDNDNGSQADSEAILYCGGEAWMENADGSGKRRKIGPFSLMKLKTVDRSKLIYTVPASRGGLGGSNKDDENML